MLTRSVDIALIVVYCLLILGGTLPFIFHRQHCVRFLCVGFILLATLFAAGRVYISPHMAIDRMQAEKKTWTESFRDGSLYTWRAACTALPVFALAVAGLSAMALFPPSRR
jgi:hypothetical protein